MKLFYKQSLIFAAGEVSKFKNVGICSATGFTDISKCTEFMAFCPYDDMSTSLFWWNESTMDENDTQDDIQNARLIAIAFMITMPEDMVPEL